MMKHPAAFTMALLSLATLASHAEPTCRVGQQEKLYRLDLSIPAAFCRTADKDDPSCKSFPKQSVIQLHGLWPNYKNGFPEGTCAPGECKTQEERKGKYCKYPAPPGLYTSDTWKKYKGYMAGTEKCLERHEWIKHGTCSPMSAVKYFDWSLQATKHIAESLAVEPDQPMMRQEFDQKIKDKLPQLDGAIRLTCKKDVVSGIYVLYEWGQTPGRPIKTKSGANSFGNCPQQFTFPSEIS